MTRPTIAFIGAGRLAASLALAVQRAGYPITAIASRDPASAATLATRLGNPALAALPEAATGRADLVFLTAGDGALAGIAAALPWSAGQVVAHCAGARGLAVLDPVAAAGGYRATFHPLQTFPSRAGDAALFEGAWCGVEGDGLAAPQLEDLARAIGARPFSLAGVDRTRYHAAAVFASNFLAALVSAAGRTWEVAGLDPAIAREALAPLLLAAASNLAHHAPATALTGPVARGDAATVAGHIAALADTPDLATLYRALTAELLRLELPLPPDARDALRDVLR